MPSTPFPVWEFPLNWAEPPLDRYEWMTDVIGSHANYEERSALRAEPRRKLEASFIVKSDRLGRLDALLFNGAAYYMIPLWMDVGFLTAPIADGESSIACDTSNRDFFIGGYALIGNDPSSMMSCVISGIHAGSLDLSAPFVGDAPSGTRIYPARKARISSPADQTQQTAGVVSSRVTFQIDDQPGGAGVSTGINFGGFQVLTRRHNWSQGILRSYARSLDILDNSTNTPVWIDRSNFSQITRSNRFLLKSLSDRRAFVQWLYSVQGRLTPFWRENRETIMHFSPRQGPGATNTLHVLPFGFVDYLYQKPQRLAVSLLNSEGINFRYNITSATVDGATGDEVIVLDGMIPAAPVDSWPVISYIELVRLQADAIEVAYLSADVAQVAVGFIGVRQ